MSAQADALMGIFGMLRATCADCQHAHEGMAYPRMSYLYHRKFVDRKHQCSQFRSRKTETDESEWTEGDE